VEATEATDLIAMRLGLPVECMPPPNEQRDGGWYWQVSDTPPCYAAGLSANGENWFGSLDALLKLAERSGRPSVMEVLERAQEMLRESRSAASDLQSQYDDAMARQCSGESKCPIVKSNVLAYKRQEERRVEEAVCLFADFLVRRAVAIEVCGMHNAAPAPAPMTDVVKEFLGGKTWQDFMEGR